MTVPRTRDEWAEYARKCLVFASSDMSGEEPVWVELGAGALPGLLVLLERGEAEWKNEGRLVLWRLKA